MMKYFICTLVFFISPFAFFSQSSFSQFKKLSRPEKFWTLSHPFIAKKAFLITKKVSLVVDSIKRIGIIGSDNNGGKLDAFKHAYWMSSLTNKIGRKKALRLGKAHEKGNYLQYKKHLLEDSILPDSVSSEMDLRNNEKGINSIGRCHFKITEKELQDLILLKLDAGELYVIKKDAQGNFLTCDGAVIPKKDWLGKWGIPKCLVSSGKD